jgi:3-hydroxyisobutyrate dehydrogenase
MEEYYNQPFVRIDDTEIVFAVIGKGFPAALMAEQLILRNQKIYVHITDPKIDSLLTTMGATHLNSPLDALKHANIIISFMDTGEEVEELYLGKDGLLERAKPGTYFIEMTGQEPSMSQDLGALAAVNDLHFLDCAPVYPLVIGDLNSASLAVGATREDFHKLEDILKIFYEDVVYVGSPGQGSQARLASVIASCSFVHGIVEAYAFADVSNLKVDGLASLLTSIFEGSTLPNAIRTYISSETYRIGTSVSSVIYDLETALDYAESFELALPGTEVAYQLLCMLSNVGGDKMAIQALALLYEEDTYSRKFGLDWSDAVHSDFDIHMPPIQSDDDLQPPQDGFFGGFNQFFSSN